MGVSLSTGLLFGKARAPHPGKAAREQKTPI